MAGVWPVGLASPSWESFGVCSPGHERRSSHGVRELGPASDPSLAHGWASKTWLSSRVCVCQQDLQHPQSGGTPCPSR